MTSFFGKIVLYRPFLHYLAKSSDGRPTAQKASQRALACIRIASTAITRSEAIQQLGLLRPASWTSIYTTFLSVVCLVFLIATREGTTNPIEAWRKAESGICLLASTTCHETGSKQCLGILKVSRSLLQGAPMGSLESPFGIRENNVVSRNLFVVCLTRWTSTSMRSRPRPSVSAPFTVPSNNSKSVPGDLRRPVLCHKPPRSRDQLRYRALSMRP